MESESLDEFKTSHRKPRRAGSLFTRLAFGAFGLFALAGLVGALSSERAEPEPPDTLGTLVGGIVLCFGMAFPWHRIRVLRESLHWPGSNLGFISNLTGWTGAGLLPFAVITGTWVLVPLAVVAVAATTGLWTRRRWAIWPWYAVALACLAASVMFVLKTARAAFRELEASTPFELGQFAGGAFGILFYGVLGLFLLREIRAWRRGLPDERPQRAARD